MAAVLTNAEKTRHLHWNTFMNATNMVFVQFVYWGSAFVLFLDALGFNKSDIGFLLALLLLSSAIALFIAPAIARFGYKRSFVLSFGLGRVVTLGLLFVPLVRDEFGTQTTLIYVTIIVLIFALCKGIYDTAMYPWSQEFIPNTIRGRYSAVNDIAMRISGVVAIAVAGYVLAISRDLDGFILLIAIGTGFGFIATWSAARIVGGAPQPEAAEGASLRRLIATLRDRNFAFFVVAFSAISIGSQPMYSFLPLYMTQEIGLAGSAAVWLQLGSMLGGLAATYLVGWAADRYGSKPVMLVGLALKVMLPVIWMLMPRASDWSLPVALGASVLLGIGEIAWAIGVLRLLFVGVVPSEHKSAYMAVFTASAGIATGIASLLGGWLLDASAGIQGAALFIPLDPFSPLFVLGLALTLAGIALFSRVRGDSRVSVSEFVGVFTHGNPVTAMGALVRYYRARDERQTIVLAERMSQTKSPLTEEELLEALKDPRFNVRFEAVISIARMDASPQLVDALCRILDGTELSLSVVAAWALGRLGDARALPTLRRGLDSNYRSIQAHCARALGTLGDRDSIPRLHERLRRETDKGLRMAYAAALGSLRAEEALPALCEVLRQTENEGARLELALALGRIVGREDQFIRLLRSLRQDRGSATSQAVDGLRRRIKRHGDAELLALAEQCANAFAREHFDDGIGLLVQIARAGRHSTAGRPLLDECAARLEEFGDTRSEYLLLTLHTLLVVAQEPAVKPA